MNIRWNDTPEKKALREKVLPKSDLIESLLVPALEKKMKSTLVDILKQEIEIYKAFPKTGKMNVKTFDPRNHKTCFQGQAHDVQNTVYGSADLAEYRKKVGTIAHSVWGKCTLLEIWAGDHFENYTYMVTQVFKYCKGDIKNLPPIKFHVMPLFNNNKTGKYKTDDDDREVALHKYKIELNGQLAEYGKKPVKEITGVWLEDFEKIWKARPGDLF